MQKRVDCTPPSPTQRISEGGKVSSQLCDVTDEF